MSKFIKLSHEQVKRIAELVQLQLSKSEIEKYSKELTDTLRYVQNLEELDTTGILPTSHATDIKNQFLLDALGEKTLSTDKALREAPKKRNGYFQIKGFGYNK